MKEIILNREFENFYCPMTGQAVLMPYGYQPSPALLFIYVEEIRDFEYCSRVFREKFPIHFNEQGETLHGSLLYKTLKLDLRWGQDKLLITYGTMGPATLCFDLGYGQN